jgi:hypothetical protein
VISCVKGRASVGERCQHLRNRNHGPSAESDKQIRRVEWRQLYRSEARVLGELGSILASASVPQVEVRLRRELAEQAVTAWERDDDEAALDPETYEQRMRGGTVRNVQPDRAQHH